MSWLFTTEKEKHILQMKKRYLHSILEWNKQEMEAKYQQKKLKEEQKLRFNAARNKEALDELMEENRQKELMKLQGIQVLKCSYDRQIQAKSDKIERQKIEEKFYQQKFKEHQNYEEERRMRDIQRMFNRRTYVGVPAGLSQRLKTMPDIQQHENPERYRSIPHNEVSRYRGSLPQINPNQNEKIQRRPNSKQIRRVNFKTEPNY